MKVRAQIGMVLNLDKCIGCHTCSVTCKNVWTSREGMEYAWFNNVETKPGVGYPREWENQDTWNGGWRLDKGNKLCTRCHQADVYDSYDHHFHKEEYEGKPSDGKTLFLAVQHPADAGVDKWAPFGRKSTFEDPATRWPDFSATERAIATASVSASSETIAAGKIVTWSA